MMCCRLVGTREANRESASGGAGTWQLGVRVVAYAQHRRIYHPAFVQQAVYGHDVLFINYDAVGSCPV